MPQGIQALQVLPAGILTGEEVRVSTPVRQGVSPAEARKCCAQNAGNASRNGSVKSRQAITQNRLEITPGLNRRVGNKLM